MISLSINGFPMEDAPLGQRTPAQVQDLRVLLWLAIRGGVIDRHAGASIEITPTEMAEMDIENAELALFSDARTGAVTIEARYRV